jgi:5-formyltetrahydrofolate cyclo-ligase
MKQKLRANVRTARCSIDAAKRRDAAVSVSERLLALPETVRARLVLTYSASPEELDPHPAVEVLRMRGVSIAYPRIDAPGRLEAHVIGSEEDLEPGAFGVSEPTASAPVAPLRAVDIVIVPGIAFDPACARIGYGGGYYDRLLARLDPRCTLIGIAFDEQVVERIPVEPHDVALDFVVTPSHVLGSGA